MENKKIILDTLENYEHEILDTLNKGQKVILEYNRKAGDLYMGKIAFEKLEK